jgi:hypothetical protein
MAEVLHFSYQKFVSIFTQIFKFGKFDKEIKRVGKDPYYLLISASGLHSRLCCLDNSSSVVFTFLMSCYISYPSQFL